VITIYIFYLRDVSSKSAQHSSFVFLFFFVEALHNNINTHYLIIMIIIIYIQLFWRGLLVAAGFILLLAVCYRLFTKYRLREADHYGVGAYAHTHTHTETDTHANTCFTCSCVHLCTLFVLMVRFVIFVVQMLTHTRTHRTYTHTHSDGET